MTPVRSRYEREQGPPAGHLRVEAYVPPAISFDPGEEPGEIFGTNVFSVSVMQKRLPKSVYKSVLATIEKSTPSTPTSPTPSPRR